MRKPEEIKKGLLNQDATVYYEAITYIQRLEEEKADLLDAIKKSDMACVHCKHAAAHEMVCDEMDYNCLKCTQEQCRCRECHNNNHWEWCGLPEHAGGNEQ